MATPEIRFTTEQDDWELLDLDQNAIYSKGRGYSKNDLVKTGTPVILYGRLYTDFQIEIDQVDTFVNPIQDSVISTGNEVVVPASGETPEDIARASAVIESGLVIASDLNIIRPNYKLNPTFLASSLTYGSASKSLMSKAQGNVIVHLKNDDIRSLAVYAPSPAEQTKINSVFRHIDNQINSLKISVEQLKSLKQTMLIKMFPQGGASVPEIRFKGFTGDWKEGALENLVTRKTQAGFDNSLPRIEYEDIISHTGRLNKNIYSKKSQKVGILFESGDVLYGKLRPYLGNWILADFTGVAVGDFWVLRGEKLLPPFLFAMIQSSSFKQVTQITTGSKMPRADWSVTSKHSFLYPSSAEQAAIGSYFRQLDQLIELEEAKLAKLTQLKTAFLSKMFV